MLNSLLVFDIETIPDTDSCVNLIGDDKITNDDIPSLREKLVNYHLEITNGQNAFLRQPFHKVITISFLKANIKKHEDYEIFSLQEIRSGGNCNATEKELIQGFFKYLTLNKPRLVSFNGRTFDLPVLKYRAMAHGIQAGYLYKSGDKWNNYMQRYSIDWHCDLLEYLSDFGASARIKMNEVCSILNFPGKFGVDGSQVTDLYDTGQIEAIRNYCETDVINTYLVYIRLMHHQERISTLSYNKNIEELLLYLETSNKKHFLSFQSAWHKACNGNFYI